MEFITAIGTVYKDVIECYDIYITNVSNHEISIQNISSNEQVR